MADGVHRLFRLALLNKTDNGICHHHGQNNAGIDPVIQRCRNHSRADQHINQDVVKLQQETHEGAALGRFRQAVRAILF